MNHTAPLAPRLRRALAPAAAACLALGAAAAGCQDRPVCPVEPRLDTSVHERLTTGDIDKVDVLLAIDNSASMADKQALLALAVPDLVQGLVNPPCLGQDGSPVQGGPASPLEACPKGSARAFEPILDIHVGVVSSSLGAHGADSCPVDSAHPSNDDKGHLLWRSQEDGDDDLPTYQKKGFLAWDPTQKLSPAGEADLFADTAADADTTALIPVLADMIVGTGQNGCGFESQLESWYRFLADPSPHTSLAVDASGKLTATGTDDVLLSQRKAFLRPDSLLAIVQLTDENDCSVRETGQYYLALQMQTQDGGLYHLPAARAECATDPQDACCFSCGQKGPKNDDGTHVCPEDPSCTDPNGDPALPESDFIGLRCWDQKRRFGIDFLYPIERYRLALTSPTIVNRGGEVVPNPIFSDLDPTDANFNVRDPNMVVLTGIVGVPWQDLARDPKNLAKGFKSAAELDDEAAAGGTTWDLILGDPEKGVLPADPLMIESVAVRSGTNPITGEPIATSATPLANSINGHDMTYPHLLQYACIFPLTTPIPCTATTCHEEEESPVFDPPYDQDPTQQVRAGARPGTRFLSLLRALGSQGVVASVCPAQTSDAKALDFGYRPAIAAALDRIEVGLSQSCLPRQLTTDAGGEVACAVVEARHADADGTCCDPERARLVPAPERESLVKGIKADAGVVAEGYDCFCEIAQLQGNEPGQPLWTCQNDVAKAPVLASGETVNGYCYVDPTATPPVGNPELVASCPETEKRTIRFVGEGHPRKDAAVFVTCGGGEAPSDVDCQP